MEKALIRQFAGHLKNLNPIPLSIPIVLLLSCFCCTTPRTAPVVLAENTYGNIILFQITSVYDGDTFRANIPDYPPIIGQDMPIRINGIDCPEIRDKRKEIKQLAIRAREFTRNKLENGRVIKLKNMQRGKYFRIIADVEIDGQDLGSMLIQEGLARRYDGGERGEWEVQE
ncbi:MAG TPA: thermonuclease family protein [Sedimentisphaerales bacterium]|nr:thermonuclease family protein [Sedimentisphaerales bacterium]